MTSQAAKRFVGIGEQLPRLGARGNKQTLLAAVVQGLIWAGRTEIKKGFLRSPFCPCHCGDNLNPFSVFAGAGVNFHLVALGHKNWHTNLKAS